MGYEFVYGTNNYSESIAKIDALVSALSKTPFKTLNFSDLELARNNESERNVELSFSEQHGLSCTLRMDTSKPSEFHLAYLTTGRAADFFFNCNKNVKRPIYPLAQ
jgi:hypothetical protein